MTEDKLNTLRQRDTNLRDAIRLDEMERPQMPAGLNARLMKRMEQEKTKSTKHSRLVWPWIAAACVAAFIAVYLTPPKGSSPTPLQVEKGVVAQKGCQPKVEETDTKTTALGPTTVKQAVAKVQPKKVETPKANPQEVAKETEKLMAQEVAPQETKKVKKEKSVTLTESDIPITRPENYKYTQEEIALMKKQAHEAYLKWVELELEIAKNNLEQTAQNQ